MSAGDPVATTPPTAGSAALPIRREQLARTLREIRLFTGLSREDLSAVAGRFTVRQYRAGTRVVTAGVLGDFFHVILAGTATVDAGTGSTRALGPGDAFGELAALDCAPRSAAVVAGDGLVAAVLPGGALRRLLRDEPVVAVGLLPGLVRIVRDLQQALEGERPRPDERRSLAPDGTPALDVDDGRALGCLGQ